MRKIPIALLFAIVAAAPSPLKGATVEVMPMVGYQFNGAKDLAGPRYDRLDLKDVALRGLSIGYLNDESAQLEFSWTRSFSSAEILRTGGAPAQHIDVRIDRLHLNGLYMFGDDSVQPFLLVGIGGTRMTPSQSHAPTTRVSAAFGGGVKWLWNDHIGLRVDGRWTPAYVPRGTHFFCDESGSGECYSTEANSVAGQYPLMQNFEFVTGLLLRY